MFRKHWLSLAPHCVTLTDTAVVSGLFGSPLLSVKMAEVGQRLWSGAYRFTAVRNSHGLPVHSGESPGHLQVICTVIDGRVRVESTLEQPEPQTGTEKSATQNKTLKDCRGGKIESQHENMSFCCATSWGLCSLQYYGFDQTRDSFQTYKTTMYLSARQRALLHQQVLPGRVTHWFNKSRSVHPYTFRNPQHLRALCTVIFILTEQGSEGAGILRLKYPKMQPEMSTFCRGYSGWSDNSDPPLYRSRTAYYDILKVSKSATHPQIKTAYYKQSFIYHPDKNPGNEAATQRFSEISEAYTVLGNISLRRKYDRGILSQSDLQNAGRPSSKDTARRTTGSPQQHRARRFSQAGEKTKFDFDAFYQAHYGEQLQRERDLKARKQRMQEQQNKNLRRWEQGKTMEMAVAMLLATAGLIFVNLCKP